MKARNDLPFLNLPMPLQTAAVEAEPSRSPKKHSEEALREFQEALAKIGTNSVSKKYALTIESVQSKFQHLAIEDIYHPPHSMFDAALARQIALHIMHHELSVPKRRLSEELSRSREMLLRAIRTVDERKQYPEFERTYQQISDDLKTRIKKTRRPS